MAGITRYEAERRIKQVFEEYVGALKTAAYKKEYLKAEALSLFSGLETFETFTKTKELTELYSALNTEGIRELFRISMALAYLYRLPSYKKYKDSVIEYQKLYKIKADSREYIGEERNMEVEQGRTIRFRLEQVNDYLRSGGSEIYYTVEWKKKDKTGNDKSGWVNNRVKDSFDDNPYDRDFKFNESGNYIIEADVVERLCMRQEYRKVVEHNELEVIVVPGDERIRAMPFSEKLKIALEYADWEGAAYKARDMALLFAACSVILGVIALTPLDEVIIVLAPVLELIGYGGAAIEFAKAVYKLADFVDRVRNAQSEGALAEAGSIFAEAAAAVGITILFAFLGRLSKMTKERFRNRKQVTVNSAERYGHSPAKAYKTEAQIAELAIGENSYSNELHQVAHNASQYAKYQKTLKAMENANPFVDSLKNTGKLPVNYLTKEEAEVLGWRHGKPLNNYAKGCQIGGGIFENVPPVLPKKSGRIWYEADIGLDNTVSRSKQPGTRLLYSNDGLLYITIDHYRTVIKIGTWK